MTIGPNIANMKIIYKYFDSCHAKDKAADNVKDQQINNFSR